MISDRGLSRRWFTWSLVKPEPPIAGKSFLQDDNIVLVHEQVKPNITNFLVSDQYQYYL